MTKEQIAEIVWDWVSTQDATLNTDILINRIVDALPDQHDTKERDYIRATNLAKLRIAESVLRTVLPTKQEESTVKRIVGDLIQLIGVYERLVD